MTRDQVTQTLEILRHDGQNVERARTLVRLGLYREAVDLIERAGLGLLIVAAQLREINVVVDSLNQILRKEAATATEKT